MRFLAVGLLASWRSELALAKTRFGRRPAPQRGKPSALTAEGHPDSPIGEGLNPPLYSGRTPPDDSDKIALVGGSGIEYILQGWRRRGLRNRRSGIRASPDAVCRYIPMTPNELGGQIA
jgi:hypothetical protein